MSGMRVARPVRVAVKTKTELQAFLVEKLAEEMPRPAEAAAPYVLLGLLPPGLDLADLLLSLYMEQVAGLYEPDSAALFVVAGQPESVLEPLLVHELVHAVQDQHANLDSLTARERGNDARAAARAAAEGHAMLATMEWAAGGDAALAGPLAPEAARAVLAAETDGRYPALAAAPAFVRKAMLFPYLEGLRFVQAVRLRGGARASPLGDFLPTSTEQVAHPGKVLDTPRDLPVRLAFSADEAGRVDAGGAPARLDNLGWMELEALAEAWGGDPGVAAGWSGDAYALFGSPGRWSLRWVVAWDDSGRRDAFVAWAERAPAAPPGVRVAPVDVEGLPGAEVLAGTPPEGWTARVVRGGRAGR